MLATLGDPRSKSRFGGALSSRKLGVALCAALLCSLFLQVNVSHAATFTVNSVADAVDVAPGNGVCATATGVCTLRAAIQETNALAGADTIVLPAGLYVLTIPGANEDLAATGDLDIAGDLTITGAGAATTIIDGNGVVTGDRVFEVSPASGLVTVRISRMTIRGGAAPLSQNGGAFRNLGNLSLDNVTVTQNTAGASPSSDSVGGGITNSGGAGAILNITNSSITNNTVHGRGGGVRNGEGATLAVTNTTLSGNTANVGGGGGIHNQGTASVGNSSITGNSASSSSGGGFQNASSGFLTVNATTISQNSAARSGGGIQNLGGLTLDTVQITNNHAGQFAGALNNFTSQYVRITNSMISGNRSDGSDGGITQLLTGSTLVIQSSTISGNVAAAGDGGGLSVGFDLNGVRQAPLAFVQNSTISRNSAATIGGGIRIFSGSVSLSDSTVSENSAALSGGGIEISTGALTLRASALVSNVAAVAGGGLRNNGGAADLENATFSANRATNSPGFGGAISNAGGQTTLNNVTIANSANAGGGALSNLSGSISIHNSIVSNTTSGGDCAGPITSNGHNLSSDASCAFAGPGDVNNTNPNLGPLANNGGPTQTHALLAGSPAIDGGTNAGCPSTDQRGVVRPLDGNGDGTVICDIGAYELQPAPTIKNRAASVEGSGAADSSLGPVDFSVSVNRATTGGLIIGSLTKTVRSNNLGIRSTEITELVILSSNRVLVEGRCVKTPTGEPCTFLADISDSGPGGANDSFVISTNGGPQLGGRLLSGDVKITVAPQFGPPPGAGPICIQFDAFGNCIAYGPPGTIDFCPMGYYWNGVSCVFAGAGTTGLISFASGATSVSCVRFGTCSFTIQQSGGDTAATVSFTVSSGTAMVGSNCGGAADVAPASGTVFMAPNSTAVIVVVTCAGSANAVNETFTVTLTATTAGAIASPSSATGTMTAV